MVGIHEVGHLHGVLGGGERQLFVCADGFADDAKNAPFVWDDRVALVDGNRMLDLILQHHEEIPPRARALLQLRKLNVPEAPPAA